VTPLQRKVEDRIRRSGPLAVADYMALTLSDPDHGYYTTRDPLGATGDFVTAPEISQMFGEMIGLWCAVAWQQSGAPRTIRLVELGPGRGTLMADALRAAATLPPFRDAIELHLVETSPVLRARQHETLGDAVAGWHETLDDVPAGPMLAIANEFFDALPIRQYQRTGEGWRERLVGLGEDGRLCFTLAPMPAAPDTLPRAASVAANGQIVERCPQAEAILRTLARRLARDGGAALIVDYGPAESGPGETLQAVRGHAFHDPLEAPGTADLTAHVDFATLAACARDEGAATFGPIPQGAFLRRIGIARRLSRLLAGADENAADSLRRGYDRLIDGDGMGTLFKVLGVAAPGVGIPAGFETGRSP
jgi:NADH dehydrogenase [ubiquinone] 1 alpha subcomplex assembly factor 7